jgi:hypothetical protein
MATPTSQGSTVSFRGVEVGRLRSWKLQPGSATFEESTNVLSPVIGSGQDARVVKQYTCTAIDPGGVDLTVWGVPPFSDTDIGSRGTLSVVFDGGSLSREAYLETFDGSGNVGEFISGSARFKFSGIGWS